MTDTSTTSTSVDDNRGQFVEAFMSQVDNEDIATIIGLQKKSYDCFRFFFSIKFPNCYF